MIARFFPLRSIKTRVTLLTLVLFVAGTWTLSLFAAGLLREDMQRMLGEQQLSIASAIASEINSGLIERVQALQTIAKEATPAMMGNTAALQTQLEQRSVLQLLFNGGIFITDATGTAIADVPLLPGRIGTNYLDRQTVSIPLKEGRTVIGRPAMGKKLGTPIFSIAAPILGGAGQTVGTIVGTINLGMPTFLDQIAQNQYGKTGGYLLIAPQHKLFVTATDKSRVLQPLPAPGLNAMHDRYMQGYEGFGVAVSSRGVLELSAAKGIPAAGWFVVVVMPAKEAFAPIDGMLQRLFASAVAFTVLAGGLVWWLIHRMLRRQLAPVLLASRSVAALADGDSIQGLSVTSHDEIGELIGGFNRLLGNYAKRESSLRESEAFKNAILNSLNAEIAVVDPDGVILAVNDRWQRFAIENSPEPGQPARNTGVGANYFSACGAGADSCVGNALDASAGLQSVLAGRLPSFSMEYACDSPTVRRWFTMAVMSLGHGAKKGAVITHTDISGHKQAQEKLRLAACVFSDAHQGITIADPDGVIIDVNDAFASITGYSREEVVGQTPRFLQSGRQDKLFYADMWRRLAAQGHWNGELWNRRKNGEIYPAWLSIATVRDEEGNITNYVGSHDDISELKRAEDALIELARELTESRGSLRALASQKEARLERDRKHIAREVHDELGQVLTALRMNLSMAIKGHGNLAPGLALELQDMKKLVDQAIAGVRNVAANLRPGALDMGLVAAIEWLGTEFSKRMAIPCTITVQPESCEIDETRAVVFFRIVQESLTNIARHAEATQVDIQLDCRGDALRLEVRDNGRGFIVSTRGNRKTFGLLGMRERSLALGGTLDINSTPGLGTVVVVLIPINETVTENYAS